VKRIGKKKTQKGRELIHAARTALEKELNLSTDFKVALSGLIDFTEISLEHLGISSSTSNLPPSQDPFRDKKVNRTKAKGKKRRPGAQEGHLGSQLKQVDNPSKVEQILVDRTSLPQGDYKQVGLEKRQVFDVEVSVILKEY
jgi:hypothetical protein